MRTGEMLGRGVKPPLGSRSVKLSRWSRTWPQSMGSQARPWGIEDRGMLVYTALNPSTIGDASGNRLGRGWLDPFLG